MKTDKVCINLVTWWFSTTLVNLIVHSFLKPSRACSCILLISSDRFTWTHETQNLYNCIRVYLHIHEFHVSNMFVFINVYLGKMSQSNGPPKNRSSIIDPCVLHYSVVCWQIETQVRFIVQVSIPMRIISFCMILHVQYTVYIYVFILYIF